MANVNRFFVDSNTIVFLQGLRGEDEALLDGSASVIGHVAKAGHIVFDYDGTPGNFTGVVPVNAGFIHGKSYTMRIRVRTQEGLVFTLGITRPAVLIAA